MEVTNKVTKKQEENPTEIIRFLMEEIEKLNRKMLVLDRRRGLLNNKLQYWIEEQQNKTQYTIFGDE